MCTSLYMRPYGLVNSECPPACAPAKGQKNRRVSHFNQKPGYVKRAAHRRPHQNSNLVCFLFNQKVQKAAAPESCRSVPRRSQHTGSVKGRMANNNPTVGIMGITDMFLIGFLFGHGKSPFLRLWERGCREKIDMLPSR